MDNLRAKRHRRRPFETARKSMDISRLLSDHNLTRSVRQSPEFTVVKNVVRRLLLLGQQEVLTADRLPSDIHLTYLLELSDGARCIFKSSPGLGVRLLRNEQHALENESQALQLLNQRTGLPAPCRLIFGSNGHHLALRSPFLLRSYIPGTPWSQLSPRISQTGRTEIERALGAHYATLSCQTESSFGSPHAVHSGAGSRTWRQAFLILLEAALRDAEDHLVSLPYDSIRRHVVSHANALDTLPQPEARLTALSFCSADKVLLDEDTLRISGLIGLDDVLWGDPEFAPIFQDPAPAFLEGYGHDRIIDDDDRAIRLLLYRVHHCTSTIIKAQYRPGSGADELLARRELADSLISLASMPEDS